MLKKSTSLSRTAELRRRAEAKLRAHRRKQKSKVKLPKSEAELGRLLHELQVHQVELEMQNDELRKARDEMEAGLEKYSDLYDFAPVGYLTLDREGAIDEANLASASLLKIPRAALVKQRLGAFVSPADRPVFADFIRQVFKSGAREECLVRLLVEGKHAVDARLRANAFGSGQACRVAVTDITEQKRAENKVRVSEIRHRRLFETAHDGILLIDPGTRKITDANPFMTKLLGYPNDQLVGKELFEIGLLKDEAASKEMFQKLKRTHEVRYEDLPLESQGGRHQEVEVVANLYQENGHAVVQCNIRDITERKKSEPALRESEERFRAMANSLPQLAWIARPDGHIFWYNQRWYDYTGTTLKQMEGWGWQSVHDAVELPKVMACWQCSLATGKPFDMTFPLRGADGHFRSFLTRVIPLKNATDQVVQWFGTNTDIEDLKRAEEARRRMDVLAASNKKLEREIVRRQAVESSLQKSEQDQSRMLEQSRLLQGQLRQLSRQILTAQEEERREISRELHDVVVQTLSGINVRLAGLKREAARNANGLDRSIARTQRQVEKSVDIVHKFARELRPPALDDLGLIAALHAFMKSFTTRTGVRTRLTAFAAVEKLDGPKRTVLYRVAQEALTNVARHAKASHVDVSIQKLPGGVCMKIKDDGKSFDVERVLRTTGKGRLGLLGMRERLMIVGGCFDVESAPGEGTTIVAHLPLGKKPCTGGGGAGGVR